MHDQVGSVSKRAVATPTACHEARRPAIIAARSRPPKARHRRDRARQACCRTACRVLEDLASKRRQAPTGPGRGPWPPSRQVPRGEHQAAVARPAKGRRSRQGWSPSRRPRQASKMCFMSPHAPPRSPTSVLPGCRPPVSARVSPARRTPRNRCRRSVSRGFRQGSSSGRPHR